MSPFNLLRGMGRSIWVTLWVFWGGMGKLESVLASFEFCQSAVSETEGGASRLWAAARAGEVAEIEKLLDAGTDVNVATEYGSTALCFAADRGHLEAIRLLLQRGADPNVRDRFYNLTPLDWALSNGHWPAVTALFSGGAQGADDRLLQAASSRNIRLAKAIIESGQASPTVLALAKRLATEANNEDFRQLFDQVEVDEDLLLESDAEQLSRFVGFFATEDSAVKAKVTLDDKVLSAAIGSRSAAKMLQLSENEFFVSGSRLRFEMDGGGNPYIELTMSGRTYRLKPSVEDEPQENPPAASPSTSDSADNTADNTADDAEGSAEMPFTPSPDDALVSSSNWPSFRGTGARGIADGQNPPVRWNVQEGENLLWRTEIPGLGNSCPVIWGNRLFVTSAVSETADTDVRIGLYGDVSSVEDDSVYDFNVYCLDKETGQVLWAQTAHTSQPAVKRHSKSSHANPTIATDGSLLVAFFGSEGLYCYDLEGNLIWQRDLGFLDSGWFLDADYQWGFGSSPIIFEDRVIVQCDIQQQSFIAAFDLKTGEELWRTDRDEIPTWPTPTVHQFGDLPMLITHGTRAARGYDARDGRLLWWLPEHSEIVVPTPFVAHNLIYLASGYSPIQPIIALRPLARGEIVLPGSDSEPAEEESLDDKSGLENPIAWSYRRGGPYMPSPIVYGDYLYVCANNGVLTCYDARSGEQIYRQRMRMGGTPAFTASPIAADGHLYFTAEDGRTAVVRAGPNYRLVAVNSCGETTMSTPAISQGTFYQRTVSGVLAFRTLVDGDDEDEQK